MNNEVIFLKQVSLKVFVGALISSAIVGIYILIFAKFDETTWKILATTCIISFFSLILLCCAAAEEKKSINYLSVLGLIISILGLLIFLPGIWTEWFAYKNYWKPMTLIAIFSFAIAHVCLLSLAELNERHRWVFYTAMASILGLATLLSAIIVLGMHGEGLFRLLGVLGIIDGCTSMTIPILFKLGSENVK